MKSPSIRTLVDTFHIERKDAKLVKDLCKAVVHAEELRTLIDEKCPETSKYARSCHHDPYDSRMWRRTLVLHAIDRIIGTYGVEPLGKGERLDDAPPYEYLNAGDSYSTTLIYKRATDNLYIGCWGTIAENHPNW